MVSPQFLTRFANNPNDKSLILKVDETEEELVEIFNSDEAKELVISDSFDD